MNIKHGRLLVALSLGWLNLLGLAAEAPVWQINFAKSGVLAELRLNGLSICRPNDAKDSSGVLMVGAWLHKGRNELSVKLQPKPTAGDGSDSDFTPPPSFSFSLFTILRSDPAGGNNQLFRLKLPLDAGGELNLPWQMDFSIYLDEAPPSQLWDLAQPLQADPATLAEAKALMGAMIAALDKGDADGYFELCRWALVDMYTAYGWMSDDLEAKVRANLAEMMKGADFKLEPVNPGDLVYEAVSGSGNRLLAVHGPDGGPAIKAGAFSQDTLYLARIDGRLIMVRN
jgi:hypothetical protein